MFIIRGEDFQIVIPKTEPFAITEKRNCAYIGHIVERYEDNPMLSNLFYSDITIQTSANKYILRYCDSFLCEKMMNDVECMEEEAHLVFEIKEEDWCEYFKMEEHFVIEKV